MNYIILVFAVFMLIVGVVIVAKPTIIFDLMSKHAKSLPLYVIAIVVRLILGGVLVVYAQYSKFPLVLEVLGWLIVIAGVILLLIGHNRFKRLISWAVSLVPKFGRVAGVLAILFGGFLGYLTF